MKPYTIQPPITWSELNWVQQWVPVVYSDNAEPFAHIAHEPQDGGWFYMRWGKSHGPYATREAAADAAYDEAATE